MSCATPPSKALKSPKIAWDPVPGEIRPEWSPPAGWKRDLRLESSGLRPAIRPGLVLREKEGNLVAGDPITEAQFLFDQCAATVFLLSNGSRSFGEISRQLACSLSMEREEAEEEAYATLCELVEKQLLVLRR